MNAAQRVLAATMSEKELQSAVVELAGVFAWRQYHTWLSLHSAGGFPDLVLLRPPRLIFAELKREKANPSAEQRHWLEDLSAVAAVETYVWRPSDHLNGHIADVLR